MIFKIFVLKMDDGNPEFSGTESAGESPLLILSNMSSKQMVITVT